MKSRVKRVLNFKKYLKKKEAEWLHKLTVRTD